MASCFDFLYLGYEVIGWNLEVGDWWDSDSRRMAHLLMTGIRPGSVILLGDSIFADSKSTRDPLPLLDREAMLKALAMFLEEKAGSFQFRMISEMFHLGSPVRKNWLQVVRQTDRIRTPRT